MALQKFYLYNNYKDLNNIYNTYILFLKTYLKYIILK